MKVILIATLGGSWQVVPEVAAMLAPQRCPLYAKHPNQALLHNIQQQCGYTDVNELWIITSGHSQTLAGMQTLRSWNKQLCSPFTLKFFVASDVTEVNTARELTSLRELTYRTVLQASECGHVICSLAGGRKTMSADLQRAASIFGTAGTLHLAAPEPLPQSLRCQNPAFWAQPLESSLAGQLLPVFIGRYKRRESLDLHTGTKQPIASPQFPITYDPENDWYSCDTATFSLVTEVEKRQQDAHQLLINYLNQIAQSEHHENWRHLYRLPPDTINKLRSQNVTAAHLDLVRQLPKAELHCHIGGLPDLSQQIRIGQAIYTTLTASSKHDLRQQLSPLFNQYEWPWDWPNQFLRLAGCTLQERAERTAILLCEVPYHQLYYNLYTVTEPRIALQQRGFAYYERPGELCGSALLGHPQALESYAQAIAEYCEQETLWYLELRGSPQKYAPHNPLQWLQAFARALRRQNTEAKIRFIWIIDRRQGHYANTTRTIVQALQDTTLASFIVGVDVAGDETCGDYEALRQALLPVLDQCMPVTIHAGEGHSAMNIWQAAYHINADRIGHGITLHEHPRLQQRFRNRDICLELCPTSNREVIGFYDPHTSGTGNCPYYPLTTLWRNGVALTLNSDNPGISRTGLTREILTGSRMSESPLTLWEVLALIKQGFVHAMLDRTEKEKLIKSADQAIFSQIQKVN